MGLSDLISSGMDNVAATTLLLNVIWTMIGAILVFFMQAGFTACEAGFTRAKNAGNIMVKNMMNFVICSIFFYFVGYAFMFGGNEGGVIGLKGFFNPASLADKSGLFLGLPIHVSIIFYTMFCAAAATIAFGAMAERTKFLGYLIFSACFAMFVFPIVGNWIWGSGWLSGLRFHDFAGSTGVHMVGGICALVGAKIVGARMNKYNKVGAIKAFPGHNIPLTALGVFIIWFCWFGFTCGSTHSALSSLGDIAVTTNLAAVASTATAFIFTWVRYGKPDVPMTLNAAIAGLVAISSGCDAVNDYGALAIGIVAGIVVVLVVEYFERILKIDDPVGAISVHGVCGFVGTVLTGLLAKNSVLKEVDYTRLQFLGIQVLGALAVFVFVLIAAIIIFVIIDKTIGLRVGEKEELDGLDLHEHGIAAYANFHLHDDK